MSASIFTVAFTLLAAISISSILARLLTGNRFLMRPVVVRPPSSSGREFVRHRAVGAHGIPKTRAGGRLNVSLPVSSAS